MRSEVLGRTATLFVDGEIDMSSAAGLSAALDAVLVVRPSMLCIDLSGVTFCDSTGFRVLVKTAVRAGEQGCAVVTRGVTAGVMRVVEILGVQAVLGIVASPPGEGDVR